MIKINTTYTEKFLNSMQIKVEMESSAEILAAVQQGEACYWDTLGWHDIEQWASADHVRTFKEIAAEIRQEAQVVVLIGVGGSNNAARAVIEALSDGNGPQIVYAGTSTSAYTINCALEKCRDKSVYVINIAKNFETLEPGVAFRVFRNYLQERYAGRYNQRIIALGTIGSSLEKLCQENGFRFVPFATEIGGRFTAISSVGLIPMAVAGIDIEAVVQGAKDIRSQLRCTGAAENMALRYAAVRNLLYRKGYRVEMLSSFEPQLRWFYKWWIQLFAESEGKDEKGLYPTASEYSEDLHSVGQFVQDGHRMLFETFLQVESAEKGRQIPPSNIADGFDYLTGIDFTDVNMAAYSATIRAHSVQVPCVEIQIGKLDAYHFGQLFYFFEFACYLSGRILGINPFDQPGVEAYKKLMFETLGK